MLKSVTVAKAALANRFAEHRPGRGKENDVLMLLSGEKPGIADFQIVGLVPHPGREVLSS